MQDYVSRVVGLERFEAKRVIEVGDRLHSRSTWSPALAAAPIAGAEASM
jgi:hypothetical protein